MKTLALMIAWGERVADGEQTRFIPEFVQRAEVSYDPKNDPDHMKAYGEMVDNGFMDAINRLFRDIERKGSQ